MDREPSYKDSVLAKGDCTSWILINSRDCLQNKCSECAMTNLDNEASFASCISRFFGSRLYFLIRLGTAERFWLWVIVPVTAKTSILTLFPVVSISAVVGKDRVPAARYFATTQYTISKSCSNNISLYLANFSVTSASLMIHRNAWWSIPRLKRHTFNLVRDKKTSQLITDIRNVSYQGYLLVCQCPKTKADDFSGSIFFHLQ